MELTANEVDAPVTINYKLISRYYTITRITSYDGRLLFYLFGNSVDDMNVGLNGVVLRREWM